MLRFSLLSQYNFQACHLPLCSISMRTVVIIIITITYYYHLPTGCLQLYTRSNPCLTYIYIYIYIVAAIL